MSHTKPAFARRHFLRHTAKLAAVGATLPTLARRAHASVIPARESGDPLRQLSLDHLHTGEKLKLVYAQGENYVPDALRTLNRFLRDHYSGEVGLIDPQLFDVLHQVQGVLGSRSTYEIISGYRCASTNENLRTTRAGGVAKKSLHMEGKAIDVRLKGVPLDELRDAAKSVQAGGVGYYPSDGFVHIDTGRVRYW
jgi:uncharacterized protein YcbK (DUF882 family)